jgi:flavin reductase (DIM6/NTAB) family NADH-FMN oxidoreductase RutF
MSSATPVDIDQQVFREVSGHYPTGVAVVTGRDALGNVLALVVGTFSSVSLDPPLVSFMPMKTSRTFDRMRYCTSLCINIIGGRQEREVVTIAQRWENKLEGIDWFASPSGDPVLSDSIAWIDTRVCQVVEAGDHWIVLCAVNDLAVTNPVAPLIFFQGGYGSFVCTSLMARMDHEILPAIQAAHGARAHVEALATRIGCAVSVFTAVGSDEMAAVLQATGAAVDGDSILAQRIPMVPPIGDTYLFDLPTEEQERWIAKLRNGDDEEKLVHRDRLAFVRANGYLVSFLPAEGQAAYTSMRQATKTYETGRMTPSQERQIRESIRRTPVDYRTREIDDTQCYDVGSLVLPVRDCDGRYTLTLRLAQLPLRVTGVTVKRWIEDARAVVAALERGGPST